MSARRKLRIVIPGGTGQLGLLLARWFHQQGHLVSAITRFPKPRPWEAVHWDAETIGHWTSSLEAADLVINLAGRSVHCRHTAANRRSILHSRVHTTELVARAIAQCAVPPRVWINASSVDIYPASQDHDLDESFHFAAAEPGDFMQEMAHAWESAVSSSSTPETRTLMLRSATVMSGERGGAFDQLLRLVRNGFGGEMGDGEQYVAWIHEFDFLRAIEFLVDREDLQGPVNLTAPLPVPNHQFMESMRNAWCAGYFGLNAPAWLVRAVCFAIRTKPDFFLKSRRVIPTRLLEAGFDFHFPEWRGACEDLVERWRTGQTA